MTDFNKRVFSVAWAFSKLFWCSSAFAYVDPPLLVPANASVGESVGVQLGAGVCDAFVSDPWNAYPQIIRTGNHIRLVVFSVHYDDPIECFWNPTTFTTPLGQFDAGQYLVQVDRVYPDLSGGLTTETLGELTLIVGGGALAATPLPANSPLTLALLFITLLVASTWFIKKNAKSAALIALILIAPMLYKKSATAGELGEVKLIELLVRNEQGAPTPDEVGLPKES